MTVILAFVLFAGLFLWLLRTTAKDLADVATVLGLAKAGTRLQARGTSAEGFAFHETRMLEGTIDGMRAELAVRTVKRRQNPYRRRGSQFTVLTLYHGRAEAVPLRLQPAGMMTTLETLQKGDAPAAVSTGDAAFDAAYCLYAGDAAGACEVLTPDMRRDLLAFRSGVAGPLADSVTGGMAAALLLGTFEVEAGASRYVLFGSPTRKLAEHLRQAVPFLTRLAGGLRGESRSR